MDKISLADREDTNFFNDLVFLHGIDFSNQDNVNKIIDLFKNGGFHVQNYEQEEEKKSVVFQLDNCKNVKGLLVYNQSFFLNICIFI